MIFSGFDEVVVIDVETTGLYDHHSGTPAKDNEGSHRVIEIALLSVSFKNLETAKDFPYSYKYYMVDPEREIPLGASKKNGLTRSDVEGKTRFVDIAQELRDFIGDSPIIAHNVEFDKGFLSYEFKCANVDALERNQGFCTMNRFSELYPAEYRSLENAANRLGIQGRNDNTHGAMEDTRIALDIASELYMIDNSVDESQKCRNRLLLLGLERGIRHLYRAKR